ncbi:MAG: KEOPS complex subunit Pcc1 [Methanobacteriota archaeon]
MQRRSTRRRPATNGARGKKQGARGKTRAAAGGARAEFLYPCDDAAAARALVGALSPELVAKEFPDCLARVRTRAASVVLSMTARDLGALRAGVNSYLRWLATAAEIQRLARR